jgi:protein TonB
VVTPSPVPPPPEEPPVIFDDPTALDIAAPPPAPPAPAAPVVTFAASEDITGRRLNPPRYPPQEARRCIGGEVLLRVTIDATGAVLDVVVQRTSRNRNLDRSAQDAARRWRFNPGMHNGVPVGGDVLVPVNFTPPC